MHHRNALNRSYPPFPGRISDVSEIGLGFLGNEGRSRTMMGRLWMKCRHDHWKKIRGNRRKWKRSLSVCYAVFGFGFVCDVDVFVIGAVIAVFFLFPVIKIDCRKAYSEDVHVYQHLHDYYCNSHNFEGWCEKHHLLQVLVMYAWRETRRDLMQVPVHLSLAHCARAETNSNLVDS